MAKRIMIVEPDLPLLRQLSGKLRVNGYEVKTYMDGSSALHEWNSFEPDLLLLSLELPDLSGISMCSDIRKISSVPILTFISEDNIDTKVDALDFGADDVILKPFDIREILARIRAVLRRIDGIQLQAEPSIDYHGDYVEYPGLFINQTSYTVKYDGVDLQLPPKELELLYCLAASPNRVFTREQLLDYVWGYDYVGDPRTVDVHIKRLRSKIKDHENWSISTVWGVGYKFLLT